MRRLKCWGSPYAQVPHSFIYKHLLSTSSLCAQHVARFGTYPDDENRLYACRISVSKLVTDILVLIYY